MRQASSIFYLLFLSSVLSYGQPHPSEVTGEKQDPVQSIRETGEEASDSAPESTEASLQRIDDLEMRFREFEQDTTKATAQSFAEIVNPFRVRKRGRFYGSVYHFHRNDNFDARNFFDPVGERLPEFKRNQFGVSFGSLISEKLIVFGTYDGLRINRGSTLLSHIPTTEMKRGDFQGLSTQLVNPFTGEFFENNQIPDSMIHPVARRMLNEIPDPNRDDPDRNHVNNLPLIENEDTFSGRVDYEFSQDTKIFGQYRLIEGNGVNVADLPAFGTTEERRWQDFSVDISRNFSPKLVSSLRLNLRRNVFSQLSKNVDQSGLLESLGISGVGTLDEMDEGYPEFRMEGYVTLGPSRRNQSPRTFFNNDFELNGTVTYTPNDHQLSFGAEVQFSQINNNRSGGLRRGEFEFSGSYTGDAFADFLLGIPDSATRGVGSDRADLRRHSLKLFFRDDWKINPKFDLSLSLAYHYFSPYRSVHDNVSTFYPLLFEPPLDGGLVVMGSDDAAAVGLGGLGPGEAVYPDRNDWAPGIGLAYSPFGNNRLVIRSSYQISYDPIESRDALDYLGRNYPFYFIEQADAPSDSPDLDLSDPFMALTPTELTIRAFEPRTRNAYIQQWQLTLQNEIRRNWVLEVTYQGRKATRVAIDDVPANVPLPGPGPIQERRPNPNFGRFELLSSRGSSIGHLLEAQIEKRFSRGFSLQSGFTWNRTFSDRFFREPSNPRNLRAERALEGFFSPKRFFLDYILDLPFGPERAVSTAWAGKLGFLLEGWRLSGRTNILAGRLFTPELSGDPNNDGVSGDRPDRIGSGRLDGPRTIDRWFATEDFAEPAPYTFGNSGRSILPVPMRQTWDISLIKRTKLSREGSILEFRVQLFNAFNNTNFEEPEETFGTSSFGQIFGAEEAREIEIAIKYSF